MRTYRLEGTTRNQMKQHSQALLVPCKARCPPARKRQQQHKGTVRTRTQSWKTEREKSICEIHPHDQSEKSTSDLNQQCLLLCLFASLFKVSPYKEKVRWWLTLSCKMTIETAGSSATSLDRPVHKLYGGTAFPKKDAFLTLQKLENYSYTMIITIVVDRHWHALKPCGTSLLGSSSFSTCPMRLLRKK